MISVCTTRGNSVRLNAVIFNMKEYVIIVALEAPLHTS